MALILLRTCIQDEQYAKALHANIVCQASLAAEILALHCPLALGRVYCGTPSLNSRLPPTHSMSPSASMVQLAG